MTTMRTMILAAALATCASGALACPEGTTPRFEGAVRVCLPLPERKPISAAIPAETPPRPTPQLKWTSTKPGLLEVRGYPISITLSKGESAMYELHILNHTYLFDSLEEAKVIAQTRAAELDEFRAKSPSR